MAANQTYLGRRVDDGNHDKYAFAPKMRVGEAQPELSTTKRGCHFHFQAQVGPHMQTVTPHSSRVKPASKNGGHSQGTLIPIRPAQFRYNASVVPHKSVVQWQSPCSHAGLTRERETREQHSDAPERSWSPFPKCNVQRSEHSDTSEAHSPPTFTSA